MENYSEISKKKTKRFRRGISKTKRNFKKKTILPVNTNNHSDTSLEEENKDNNFFQNLFSWF
jgi:hypothetical protein